MWVADGRLGGAVQFNGTSDYLAAPDSASLDIKGDRLTLAAWVKANSWATSHIIRKIPDTGTGSIYFIRVQSNVLRGDIATPAGTVVVQGVTAVRAQEWVHAALVYDGAEGRIYLNGVVDGRANLSGKIAESNNELRIGRGEPAGYLNGTIDDVRIYNRALTVEEIKQLNPPQLQAYKPQPANGDRAVATPLLQWTAGVTAVVHDVYFGTRADLGPADLVSARIPVALYYHTPGVQPGTVYYWRVDEIEADMTTVHTGAVWSFTTQAATAYQPSPANGDGSVSPAVTLAWLPGKNALKHHVYFSDSLDAVTKGAADADKGEQSVATLTPTGLEQATTYYWRVDEILIDGTIQTGPVWSFSTYPVRGGLRELHGRPGGQDHDLRHLDRRLDQRPERLGGRQRDGPLRRANGRPRRQAVDAAGLQQCRSRPSTARPSGSSRPPRIGRSERSARWSSSFEADPATVLLRCTSWSKTPPTVPRPSSIRMRPLSARSSGTNGRPR